MVGRAVRVNPLDGFGPRSWARPEVTGFGRVPMSTYLARPDVVSLDGDWAFVLRDRPEAVTADDLVGPTDAWGVVEVPGCWTMQGYDRPQYTNIQMPFPGPPPHVPDANPTGVYRRTVTLPASWADRRLVLHVAGAETVLYVHVDGAPVAMGKDSRLPHEVDLTGVVEPGRPFELALSVVRWSDATYLEDQDHWHHAGLHRGVFAYATPPVYIADVHATADYDPESGEGRLRALVWTGTDGHGPSGWSMRVGLAGREVDAVVRFEHRTDTLANWLLFEGRRAVVELTVPDVAPWSAEVPNLYHLTVTLLDPDGAEVDAVALDVGFRRVEVVGPELLVNGRPVLVKGVNRHDHDPRRGKAVTRASIEADLVLMKQHGINAVRTSHYPNDAYLYDACDRLGLYVLDEADLEAHAYLRSLLKDPRWGAAVLERITRMAQRDKNHPSIIMWSLGNESGSAPILQAAATWLRSFDPSRPVHYESGIGEAIFSALADGVIPDMGELLARPSPESDVIAPMYPEIEEIVAWATRGRPDRPLIMCEYIHAMNNSCGSLVDYWDAIRTYPGLQGGFVWDWVDQALVQQMPDGTERLAYGGDFGDEPNDGPFCLNGLVDTYRRPHPSLLELAAVIAPVRVAALDAARGVVRVTNEYDFVDLSWLVPRWVVEVDGVAVADGELAPLSLAPQGSTEFRVPVPALALETAQRAHLTLTFSTVDDQPWAPAGHVVARWQFLMSVEPGPTVAPSGQPGGRRALGDLEPTLALWRAPIDNETFGPVLRPHAARWERLGLRDAAALVAMETTTELDDANGTRVTHEVVVPDRLDDIPRVGVRLHVGPGVRTVEWLGDGPHEGYSDRRQSTRFGRWTTAVDDWSVPYVHPQASGNRTGVRWLRFLDADGAVVLTIDKLDGGGDDGLDVTVSRWTDEEVADAAHLEDLPVRDDCYVWLDVRHRGVGSAAVGPDVAPQHRVGPGPYRWSYRIR
ncbi:MAG: Beta-galactosidase [Actinomycetia bacterium]|nr:Beta-galactosidase [Actinomycetes bacterium]